MPRTQNNERAEQLRELAALIASKSNASAEISQGFRLIADAMEPCVDCGHEDEINKYQGLEAYVAEIQQVVS